MKNGFTLRLAACALAALTVPALSFAGSYESSSGGNTVHSSRSNQGIRSGDRDRDLNRGMGTNIHSNASLHSSRASQTRASNIGRTNGRVERSRLNRNFDTARSRGGGPTTSRGLTRSSSRSFNGIHHRGGGPTAMHSNTMRHRDLNRGFNDAGTMRYRTHSGLKRVNTM